MQHADEVPGPLDQEFSRPVESIMRCEDFKSNFARRLSHRYSSRSVITKRQNSMKLRTAGEEVEKVGSLILCLIGVNFAGAVICTDFLLSVMLKGESI